MCFGPSRGESRAAAQQQVEADTQKRAAIEERAKQKREDIQGALQGSVQRRGMRGGAGRRSLFQASGGGFLGRFM